MGQLAYSGRSAFIRSSGNKQMRGIEMVRRYAHLAPGHLIEHARQIDSIFDVNVPNLSHMEKQEANSKR